MCSESLNSVHLRWMIILNAIKWCLFCWFDIINWEFLTGHESINWFIFLKWKLDLVFDRYSYFDKDWRTNNYLVIPIYLISIIVKPGLFGNFEVRKFYAENREDYNDLKTFRSYTDCGPSWQASCNGKQVRLDFTIIGSIGSSKVVLFLFFFLTTIIIENILDIQNLKIYNT